MKVFDAHVHIASWPNVPQSKHNLLAGMKQNGVDACLLSHADCSSFPGEHAYDILPISAVQGLLESLVFARENPGKIYLAVWIKPLLEPTPSKELLQLIQENRDLIKSLKLHPFCERIAPNDPRLDPYYEVARTLDLPILVHTALDPDSSIGNLVQAAKKNPDLRFVAAHLELGSTHDYAIDAIRDVPNIYCDTAWVDMASAKKALNVLGQHRIFFGTDSPIDGMGTLKNPLYQSYFYNGEGLSDDLFEHLMGKNARDFYGID